MEKKLLIEQLKRSNPGLSGGEVEGLLYELSKKTDDLMRVTGLPSETLARFRKSIGSAEIENMNFNPYLWSFGDLMGVDSSIVESFTQLRSEFKKKANRELDQFYALPETSIKKALTLMKRGAATGRNIAFVGDDDLVSLALVLLNADFSSLTVFDVDRELLAFIKTKSEQLGIKNIHTENYDCREDLKSHFLGRFDIVMTDPPYTRYGSELFLQRSLELLGTPAEGKNIYFFYGNSSKSPEKFLKIQEIINGYGLLIDDKITNFCHYEGAESIGASSSLYILRTTPATVVYKGINKSRKIYTHEISKEEKFPFVDHIVLKVFGVQETLLKNRKKMLGILNDLCRRHRFKVVDTNVTEFKGKGFTIVYVLSNSNLTVHTWPEHNALHIDLITCSPIYDKPSFPKNISELFSTDRVEVSFVE